MPLLPPRPPAAPLVTALLGLALLLSPLAGCDAGDTTDPSARHLLGIALVHPGLEEFAGLAQAAGLAQTLQGEQALTVFAPSNEALAGLGQETLTAYLNPGNRDLLAKVLRRHIVPGRLRAADLHDGDVLHPLEGPPLHVTVDGEVVYVEGMALTDDDVAADNGVLHATAGVLRDHLTTAERLRVLPLTSTFVQTLDRAGLTGEVFAQSPVTLFLPINNAFRILGEGVLSRLQAGFNAPILRKVLLHHAVAGRVLPEAFDDGAAVETLGGTSLTLSTSGGALFADGYRLVIGPIETADGVLYLLNDVALAHLDVAERIQMDPALSTLHELLQDVELSSVLHGEGPFTLFAAPNTAFNALGADLIAALRNDPDHLLRTLAYHIVPARIAPEDLQHGVLLTTLHGEELPVTTLDGSLFVGPRAQVLLPPIPVENGLIYRVTSPNRPPSLDLSELAIWRGYFRYLSLLESVGLRHLLEEPGPYTLFAPPDEPLSVVGEITDPQLRARILRHHIVSGLYRVSELQDGQRLPTLAGEELTVARPSSDTIYVVSGIDSIRVISGESDAGATNGRLYGLGGVLIPPQ